MRNDDPRIRELFNHVREAVSILEELLRRPVPAPEPPPKFETKVLPDPPAPTGEQVNYRQMGLVDRNYPSSWRRG
jgi:hypothetical protein